jgi:hypothetical protein
MNNQQVKPCTRPNCGGYFKEIVDSEGNVDLICSKCARFDDPKYEERVEKGKFRHEKFDEVYRRINRDRSSIFRILLKTQKANERRKHV